MVDDLISEIEDMGDWHMCVSEGKDSVVSKPPRLSELIFAHHILLSRCCGCLTQVFVSLPRSPGVWCWSARNYFPGKMNPDRIKIQPKSSTLSRRGSPRGTRRVPSVSRSQGVLRNRVSYIMTAKKHIITGAPLDCAHTPTHTHNRRGDLSLVSPIQN